MIAIRQEMCDGCGVCVEACPEGALYLVDGGATVDAGLCRGCETCVAACPREAIAFMSEKSYPQADSLVVAAPHPEPELIRIRTKPVPVTWRSRMLPLLGATVAWAVRELGPVMTEYLVDRLERRAARQPRQSTRSGSGTSKRRGDGGGRRRHRHRGGGNGAA